MVSGLPTTSSSSSSSGSTSPTSLPQESTGSISIPASIECESADEQARNNPSSNLKKKTKPNKDVDHEQVWCDQPFSEIPGWLQEFRENLVDEESLRVETHTRVLLVNPLWSRRDEWYRANTVFMLTSRKTEIARSAIGLKLQGQRAEDVLVKSYIVQKILVTW